ncbi:chorismate mutase [Mangrovicella endophytica]|uniref:chorismate mutase n=1 Tax=Mangrovicella endophytica TaxID=2066697 RepID=UPI000C9DC476|nr:chorismate mutase [Mangrovicella endophytica]
MADGEIDGTASDAERARVLLRDLRASIDNIDAAIVYMLAERFRCTETVGRLKAEHKLPAADPAREREQVARLRRLSDDARFNPDFAEKYLNFVIRHVIRHHEAVAAGEENVGLVART